MWRWWLAIVALSACSTAEESGTHSGGAAGTSPGGSGATAATSGGGIGGTGAKGGSGGGAATGGSGGSDAASGDGASGASGGADASLDGQAGAPSDACQPSYCDGWKCGTLDDGCGNTLTCKCTGPYSCMNGTCAEVAASFCDSACAGNFSVTVQTIPNAPCNGQCADGGGLMAICVTPGVNVTIVKDGVCPTGYHFTQVFKDCTQAWWYPCIPD